MTSETIDSSDDAALASPARYMFGTVENAGGCANDSCYFIGPYWVYIMDRQGRMVIPAGLRAWAGLESDAVIVGSRDHAEIWSPARWDAYRREME